MNRDEFIDKYGDLEAKFVSLYKGRWTYTVETPEGTIYLSGGRQSYEDAYGLKLSAIENAGLMAESPSSSARMAETVLFEGDDY